MKILFEHIISLKDLHACIPLVVGMFFGLEVSKLPSVQNLGGIRLVVGRLEAIAWYRIRKKKGKGEKAKRLGRSIYLSSYLMSY